MRSRLGLAVAALVGAAARFPIATLLACALLTAAAGWVTATRFALDSDLSRLFPDELSWRQDEQRMDRAFPQRMDLVVAVLDGAEPADVAAAADALEAALRARGTLFRSIHRPDADPFWASHGALFLPEAEVAALMEQLIAAQPFLGPLAADPSARGLAELTARMAEGLRLGAATPEQMAAPLAALAATAEAALRGQRAPPGWQRIMTGRDPSPAETRRFILIQPRLDHAQLSAGAAASEVIRAEAARLDLGARDVRLRLTGSVPMADEEFGTLTEGAVTTAVISFTLVSLLLWLALRSLRLILPLVALTLVGVTWTAAFGLLAVGAFNPLSIAFAVLFFGLGVDFGTQLTVQFRAAHAETGAPEPALRLAAERAGPGMTLAAAAVGLSFLAFVPTDYRGVAELGLIAGVGMGFGWLLAMTLLPALIRLAAPRPEHREIGFPALRPLESWLLRHHRALCWAGLGVAVLAGVAAAGVRFDTNPINLRDPAAESVATWRDLARDPLTDPNTLDVLAPNLPAAEALAARLRVLPEVARATTLSDFIPSDQEAKLFLIEDAAMLLSPTLDAPARPPPDETAVAEALRAAAAELARAGLPEAERLAAGFAALADAPPAARALFADAALPGLLAVLEQARAMLSAGPVALADLPTSLTRDWIAPWGAERVQVAPAAMAGDETTQLRRFARAVQAVAPEATGLAVSALESSATIQRAFAISGLIGLGVVAGLLLLALRSVRLALLALAPLGLAALLTLAHSALFGPDLNLANIIALPLLFGLGVAYDIYFVAAWRQGRRELLASPLNRAVLFSALTNAAAFGALMTSPHPGTASMGVLLVVSLAYSLVCVMLLLPPLLRRFAPENPMPGGSP